MTLGNRLKMARKRSGFTQKQLAQKIGAKHNSVSNWESGQNMPDPVMIEAVCAVLKVTPNYLLLGDELGVSQAGFTAAENEIIKKYRKLDAVAKGAVESILDYYYGLDTTNSIVQSRNAPFAKIPRTGAAALRLETIQGLISAQSVAAGSGTYLDEDSFRTIHVRKNDVTKRADYFIPVAGNSMEPKFHDGDILIIEKSNVNYGEVGIFTLDNLGYVKMRGKRELISLNPDYDPIPMNDSIICNGRVIGILEPEWLVD